MQVRDLNARAEDYQAIVLVSELLALHYDQNNRPIQKVASFETSVQRCL